jgi:hypothetical protein
MFEKYMISFVKAVCVCGFKAAFTANVHPTQMNVRGEEANATL